MQDIKPDTSLYTDLPNKLRAFAAISEAGGDIECHDSDVGVWRAETPGYSVEYRLALLVQVRDYRIKPKPRELWVVYEANGLWLTCFSAKSVADETARTYGRTVVRFVEQPE